MSFFSVIVPVYNAEKYINRCVQSVLNQSFTDFELILIDDASMDKSRDLCEKACKNDKRVHYQLVRHGGASAARNAGLEVSSGKYCVFLDADDYLATKTLENIYQAVEQEMPDVCYMCRHYVVENNEPKVNTVFEVYKRWNLLETVKPKQFLQIITSENNSMPGSSCVIVANLDFLRVNRLRFNTDLIWSEDTDFSFQIFAQSKKIAWCDYCGYYYDIGNEVSVSKKITWNKAVGRMQVYQKWAEYFENSSEAVERFDEESRKRIVQQLLVQYCGILFQYTKLPTKQEVRNLEHILKNEYDFWKRCECADFRDYVTWGVTGGTFIQKMKKVIKKMVRRE